MEIAHGEQLLYASAREITEQKQRESALRDAALRDPVTGLSSRRHFEDVFDRQMRLADRYGLRPGLVVIDLDAFKKINDRLGHQAGDQILKATADVLRGTVRRSDFPARIGGDEFAVLLPNCDPTTAERVGWKLIRALRAHRFEAEDREVVISASAGLAVLGQEGIVSAEQLMREADRAIYEAKRLGSRLCIHA